MKDFTRTKEDIVHECGILPADFVHAGAKDKLTMLACLTPEQAFRLGHVIGFLKGMESADLSPKIHHTRRANYERQWHMKKEGE